MASLNLSAALRAMRRDRGYVLLNGIGLAVALACCVLIGLFVRAELSFDRFHRDAGDLVVVGTASDLGGEASRSASVPYPLHLAIEAEAPAAEAVVLTSYAAETPVTVGGAEMGEARAMAASSAFLTTFSFPLLAGDPASALARPDGAVVTASAAKRLFGTTDAVGRTLALERYPDAALTVTAVVEDPPVTSSIQFEVVVGTGALPERMRDPASWGRAMWLTYARLRDGATVGAFERQLGAIAEAQMPDASAELFALPLPDLYFSGLSDADGFRGNPLYVGVFGIVALFILLLGVINYVNLATARAIRRAREVGVRKALGASRADVAGQFLLEAVLLTTVAAAVGVVLAALALPLFDAGFGTELAAEGIGAGAIGAALVAGAVVGLAAGAYPAVVLSRYAPVDVLRGRPSRDGRPSKGRLRQGLVVAQFAVAIALVFGTAAVIGQVRHAATSDPGYTAERLVAIPLGGASAAWEPAVSVLRQSALVEAAVPASGYPSRMVLTLSTPADPAQPDREVAFKELRAEPTYLDALGATFVAGTAPEAGRDDQVVINEALLDALGWGSPAEAIGRPFHMTYPGSDEVVVGVVRDFHFDSFRTEIEPLAMARAPVFAPDMPRTYPFVVARLAPGVTAEALGALDAEWAAVTQGERLSPAFVADEMAALYEADRRLARVLGGFALVALVLAALGLVGLSAYSVERRRKEIGIGRVLGASSGDIAGRLLREYVVLAALGAMVALPTASALVGRWLAEFPYRAGPDVALFVEVVAVAVVVAAVAISAQVVRAVRVPPAQVIRAD